MHFHNATKNKTSYEAVHSLKKLSKGEISYFLAQSCPKPAISENNIDKISSLAITISDIKMMV